MPQDSVRLTPYASCMSLLRSWSHSCSMASCTSGIASTRAILSLSTLLRSAAAFGSCWLFLFFFPVIALPRLLSCEDWAGKNPQTSRAQKMPARSLFIRLSFLVESAPGNAADPGDCWGTPGIPKYRLRVFLRQREFGRVFGGFPHTKRSLDMRRNER